MPAKLNIQNGQRYGRLVVISEIKKRQLGVVKWLCRCDCGNYTDVQGRNLFHGFSKSCGCLISEIAIQQHTTHGMSGSPIYTAWLSMKNRCYNPNNIEYRNYGGRGITICKRWRCSFENFYKDMHASFKKGLELDRIKTNGIYKFSNCKWSTHKEQQRNKRNNHIVAYNGESLLLIEWEEKIGTKANTILTRIRRGWSIQESLYGKQIKNVLA